MYFLRFPHTCALTFPAHCVTKFRFVLEKQITFSGCSVVDHWAWIAPMPNVFSVFVSATCDSITSKIRWHTRDDATFYRSIAPSNPILSDFFFRPVHHIARLCFVLISVSVFYFCLSLNFLFFRCRDASVFCDFDTWYSWNEWVYGVCNDGSMIYFRVEQSPLYLLFSTCHVFVFPVWYILF